MSILLGSISVWLKYFNNINTSQDSISRRAPLNRYTTDKKNLQKCLFLVREDNERTQGKKCPSRVKNQVEHVNIQDPNQTWATLLGGESHYANVEFLNSKETNSFSHLTFLENVEKNKQPVFTEVFRVFIGWHGLKVIQYRSQRRLLSCLVRMSDCLTPAMYIPWNTCGTNAHKFVSYEKQNDFTGSEPRSKWFNKSACANDN